MKNGLALLIFPIAGFFAGYLIIGLREISPFVELLAVMAPTIITITGIYYLEQNRTQDNGKGKVKK